ncbi:RHS repeat domain-containing protein, partial [Flavobacterium sp.]|uniref:RHS repeat domain-containing protein n=1 Tax=Flavobacterium sp. TaxID=239 RepID=UPI0022C8765F
EELPEDQFSYVYNYTDHLGNIRLSYAQDPDTQQLKIVEQNHYYPFGLRHTNYSGGKMQVVKEQEFKRMAPTPEELLSYKYKYNGKEFQDELGLNLYDYGARNYDAALGRWMNIDPLAEKYRRWSPFNYCVNNPMRFIDPDGMGVYNPGDKFASKTAAALDFAKLYNGLSILNDVELKTTIYEVKNGNETYYSYTVPTGQITLDKDGNNLSNGIAGVPDPAPEGTTFESSNHTHSKYRQPSENEFSDGDKQGVRERAKSKPDHSEFVTTPGGQVLEYNPYMPGETPPKDGKTTRVVSSDVAASDPKAPEGQRFNEIKPSVAPGTIMPIINGEENYPLKTR